MTEKLYYKDAYLKEFDAMVLSCTPLGDRFEVVLNSTLFFPNEGGQSADTGTLGGIFVDDVTERLGVVYHLLSSPLEVGSTVHGVLYFDERFDKMQQHTAEHILSGVFHSLFGLENVGFHLGREDVTFDINAVVDKATIDRVELLANRIVWENRAVRAYFPEEGELRTLEYRSKLDLNENVRIVEIEGVDACACCAPHVRCTGEVGLIKLLEFEKHRGGTRIHMAAGGRALADYRSKYENAARISAALCVPKAEIADGVDTLVLECESLRHVIKEMKMSAVRAEAERIEPTSANLVVYYPDMDLEALRELVSVASERVGGILVALGGSEGDIKYVIKSNSVNLRDIVKDMNLCLLGRGGGRPEMLQGSFGASLDDIKNYFK